MKKTSLALPVPTGRAEETMERLQPKLRVALIISVIYDLPRIYLNVHIFGSLCSLWHNGIMSRSQ